MSNKRLHSSNQKASGLPWLNLLARSFDAALLSGTPYAVGLTLAAFVYAIGDVSVAILIQP